MSEVIQARRFARMAKEPSNVIHVGVGGGKDAIELKKFWPDTRFIGIDPHHKAQPAIYPGQFIRAAVGRKPGFIRFYRRPRWQRSSIFTFPKRTQQEELVYAITLDQVLHQLDVRGTTVLWLDCEGSELFALQGGKQLIKQVTWMNVEVEGNYERTGAPPKEDLIHFMEEHNFKQVHQVRRDAIFRSKDIKHG